MELSRKIYPAGEVMLSARVPASLFKKLSKQALKQNVSVSEIVRQKLRL